MHETCGERILELNGSFSTFGNKILYWKKRNEWKDIHRFVQPSAFVAGRLAGLSGEQAYMDETFLCFSGLADLQRSCWSEELCGGWASDMGKLPRIVKSTDIIGADHGPGRARHRACRRASRSPPAAGTRRRGSWAPGSSARASWSTCRAPPASSVRASTPSASTPAQDPRLHESGRGRGVLPDLRGARRPDAQLVHRGVLPRRGGAVRAAGGDIYRHLDDKAREIPPGSDGLVSINYLQGRFFPPDPSTRGLFIGHTWAHTRMHFYRAILESIAYDHFITREIIRELLPGTDPRGRDGHRQRGAQRAVDADQGRRPADPLPEPAPERPVHPRRRGPRRPCHRACSPARRRSPADW